MRTLIRVVRPDVQVELKIDRGTPALLARALTDVRKKFSAAVSGTSQLETISQKAEEYELEKQAKIRKLNEEYDSKLLGHFTPKQRKLFDQKMGEPFEYAPVSREAESFNRLREIIQRTLP